MKYVQRIAILLLMLVITMPFVFAARDTVGSVAPSSEADFGDGENYHSGLNSGTGDINGGGEFGDGAIDNTQSFKDYESELPQGAPDISDVGDAGEQCIEKHEETSALVDALGGDVTSTIVMVMRMIKGVCKIMSMIEMVLASLNAVMGGGYDSPNCCITCALFYVGCGLCDIINKAYVAWKYIYIPVGGGFCCIINCNWCRGENCLKGFSNIDGQAQEFRNQGGIATQDNEGDKYGYLGENEVSGNVGGNNIRAQGWAGVFGPQTVGNRFVSNFKYMTTGANANPLWSGGEDGKVGVLDVYGGTFGAFGFDPYESIYISGLCLCIPGVLFNIEKLQTIYKSYDCCIEQACTYGISTEPCEKMLAEATCMYWEGSALNALLKVITGIVTGIVALVVKTMIVDVLMSWVPVLKCFVPLISLKDLPGMISSLGDDFDSHTIDDLECEDLGFGALQNSEDNALSANNRAMIDLQGEDTNGDGVMDSVGIVGGVGDNATNNTVESGILYLDEEYNLMYYSQSTGTKRAQLEDIEDRYIFIENDGQYEPYDMVGSEMVYNDTRDPESEGYLEKGGVQYDFTPDSKGNVIVVKTNSDGTKDYDIFKAAIDPQLARDLNNLAKHQAEDLRELVINIDGVYTQNDYVPPYAQRDYSSTDKYYNVITELPTGLKVGTNSLSQKVDGKEISKVPLKVNKIETPTGEKDSKGKDIMKTTYEIVDPRDDKIKYDAIKAPGGEVVLVKRGTTDVIPITEGFEKKLYGEKLSYSGYTIKATENGNLYYHANEAGNDYDYIINPKTGEKYALSQDQVNALLFYKGDPKGPPYPLGQTEAIIDMLATAPDIDREGGLSALEYTGEGDSKISVKDGIVTVKATNPFGIGDYTEKSYVRGEEGGLLIIDTGVYANKENSDAGKTTTWMNQEGAQVKIDIEDGVDPKIVVQALSDTEFATAEPPKDIKFKKENGDVVVYHTGINGKYERDPSISSRIVLDEKGNAKSQLLTEKDLKTGEVISTSSIKYDGKQRETDSEEKVNGVLVERTHTDYDDDKKTSKETIQTFTGDDYEVGVAEVDEKGNVLAYKFVSGKGDTIDKEYLVSFDKDGKRTYKEKINGGEEKTYLETKSGVFKDVTQIEKDYQNSLKDIENTQNALIGAEKDYYDNKISIAESAAFVGTDEAKEYGKIQAAGYPDDKDAYVKAVAEYSALVNTEKWLDNKAKEVADNKEAQAQKDGKTFTDADYEKTYDKARNDYEAQASDEVYKSSYEAAKLAHLKADVIAQDYADVKRSQAQKDGKTFTDADYKKAYDEGYDSDIAYYKDKAIKEADSTREKNIAAANKKATESIKSTEVKKTKAIESKEEADAKKMEGIKKVTAEAKAKEEKIAADKKVYDEAAEKEKKQLEEKRAKAATRASIAAANNAASTKLSYIIAGGIIQETLGKWGQEWIQDYCTEEYEASEPMNDKPQKITSRGPGADPDTENCMGEYITIATTQILDKFKYIDEMYKYEYMYSVTACDADVNFTVTLQSCSSDNCQQYDILFGDVKKGDISANDTVAELPGNYHEICIITSKTQQLCVPYNGDITNLNTTGGNVTDIQNVTETCEDAFDISVTKTVNNYRWLYDVRQCEDSSYVVAFTEDVDANPELLASQGYGSRSSSGVLQSDVELTQMCQITSAKTLCKNFNNEVVSETGTNTTTTLPSDTQFDKTITKTPNGELFDYEISYRIIPSESLTISTYLTKNNLVMDLETNELITDTHEFTLTRTSEDYTTFCIDTSDETFGTDGLLCEEI